MNKVNKHFSLRKTGHLIKQGFLISVGFGCCWFSSKVLADSNDDPFPKIQIQNGDVVKTVGTSMETSMKYAMIGGGVIMMLVGIGVIMHRLREDSNNKETGSFLTTLIISGLAITVGIILIAIGWGAASYQPQS